MGRHGGTVLGGVGSPVLGCMQGGVHVPGVDCGL